MIRSVDELELSIDYDLIYFYKNIKEYKDSVKRLEALHVSDMSVCLACYGMVETGILEELGDAQADGEMEFLLKATGSENEEAAAASPEGGGERDVAESAIEEPPAATDPEYKAPISADCFEALPCINKKEGEIEGKEEHCVATKVMEKESYGFFVMNLGLLLSPFIGIYNKQIVDIVYYVYRRTGINHFDILFRQYCDASDYLIELHLLMVKGAKTHSFDLREIRASLSGEQVGDKGKNEEVDFFDSASSDEKSAEPSEIGLGAFGNPQDNESSAIDSVRPFLANRTVAPHLHMDQARRLLLAHPFQDEGFFTENVSTFLALKFDRTLFLSYVHGPHGHAFFRTLNKLKHPPFFFYKTAQIKALLIEASRIENSRCSPPSFLSFPQPTRSRIQENNRPLYSHALVCNAYTLRHFVNFAMTTFTNLNTSMENYTLIAQGLPFFVKKYRSTALFTILRHLIESKISRIYNEISIHILRNIELYVNIFYNDAAYGKDPLLDPLESFDDSSIYMDDALLKEWTYTAIETTGSTISVPEDTASPNAEKEPIPQPAQDTSVQSCASGSAIDALTTPIETSTDTTAIKIPDFTIPDDTMVQFLINPTLLEPIDKSLSKVFLRSFHAHSDRKAILNSFIVEAANSATLKPHLLARAAVLKHIDQETAAQVLAAFKCTANTPWRYRAMLVLQRADLIALGIGTDWFESALAKDPVFFVRHLLKERRPKASS